MFDTENIQISQNDSSRNRERTSSDLEGILEFVAPDYSQEGRAYFYNKYINETSCPNLQQEKKACTVLT